MYTDPDGNNPLAWIVPTVIQSIQNYQNAKESGLNNGQAFGYAATNFAISGLSSMLNVPGMLPNAALHSGINILGNGISNSLFGESFFSNWGAGAISGAISGGFRGYTMAVVNNLNPITGGLNSSQRAIWLDYKNGNITIQDAVSQLHGQDYVNAGSPRILQGNKTNSRGTFYPLDNNGNRINILDASKDYTSVFGEIEIHNKGLSSGRRFLYTSYHELIHAKMFYNGDMHAKYFQLNANYSNQITNLTKRQYIISGLKIYTERWAYGEQWARYGINSDRIRYVSSMWQSLIGANNYGLITSF